MTNANGRLDMDLGMFSVWRFKTTDGVLRGFRTSTTTTSKYDGKFRATLEYDLVKNQVRIVFNTPFRAPITCSFADLVDTLRELGIYEERSENRHANSYIPYSGEFPDL